MKRTLQQGAAELQKAYKRALEEKMQRQVTLAHARNPRFRVLRLWGFRALEFKGLRVLIRPCLTWPLPLAYTRSPVY